MIISPSHFVYHYFFLEDFLVLVFFEEILSVLTVLVVVALLAGL